MIRPPASRTCSRARRRISSSPPAAAPISRKAPRSSNSTARVTLDNQIAFLRKYPNWYAKLQGFADDPGGDAQMVALSQRRADAVMSYLIANGIDAGRLWSKGYGKERVVRECSDRSCRVQNRRVITQLRTSREEGVEETLDHRLPQRGSRPLLQAALRGKVGRSTPGSCAIRRGRGTRPAIS